MMILILRMMFFVVMSTDDDDEDDEDDAATTAIAIGCLSSDTWPPCLWQHHHRQYDYSRHFIRSLGVALVGRGGALCRHLGSR